MMPRRTASDMLLLTRNWFLLGLLLVAGLAFVAPELGVRGGPLRPEITTKAGVALIFFVQGLVIAPATLRKGALSWRLHLTIQLFVFALFPVAGLLVDLLVGGLLPPDLRLGFLFLAILPTTISTCVVFTAIAGGNTTGALFNSALANIAGVLITPLLAALILTTRGQSLPLGSVMGEVALLLLAPLALGQLARPLFRHHVEPRARALSTVSSLIILFIVFNAFAGSVGSGALRQTGLATTGAVLLIAAGLFGLANGLAAMLGQRLGFAAPDRLALLFCGSQKTLAAGAPLGQILFAEHPALGLILLPLMIYHAVQLFAGSTLAQYLARANMDATDRHVPGVERLP
jgi:solute carrier family 10 (sodium/bile acid cotransporter), member 7